MATNNNFLYDIKNVPEKYLLTIVCYMYQLVKDIENLEFFDQFQVLINALVSRLNLNTHFEKVINAFIEKRVEDQDLIEKNGGKNPFDIIGVKLKKNYIEDVILHENCGDWDTSSEININLVRVLFSTSQHDFSKIIELTFFVDPETFIKCGCKIPSTVPIPKKVKNNLNDTSIVKYMADMLKLNREETSLLKAAYITHTVKELYFLCNNLIYDGAFNRYKIYSKCLDVDTNDVRVLLKANEKLVEFGLLYKEGAMDDRAISVIYENNISLYFKDLIQEEDLKDTYELSSFSIPMEKTEVALSLLQSPNPCNILLYGSPGSGKTEFAKALIEKTGIKMNSVKNQLEIFDDENSADCERRALGRLSCYLALKREDSILLVDEAENLLKTIGSILGNRYSLPQKGTVNKMLEHENKVVWILNYTNELDESTLRRFSYSIKFREMPKSTLHQIAKRKFDKINIPESLKAEILNRCDEYKVTGSSVDNIVNAVKSFQYHGYDARKIVKAVDIVLEANSSLIFGQKKQNHNMSNNYLLNVLNTTIPAERIVNMVQNAVSWMEKETACASGIRMLFYGMSGTGKSQLAKYIAKEIDRPLLVKKGSDILDRYVGGSEDNIKKAFDEAEETCSVLLFDEADSFFTSREMASQTWERTLVNEFLVQMESFSGILICTTNLRTIMDPAMNRRFHILTEFKPLDKNGITQLLSTYFGQYEFTDMQIELLAQYNSVTPGDFGSLNEKIRFIDKKDISSEFIINELESIQREKIQNSSRTIGFASAC